MTVNRLGPATAGTVDEARKAELAGSSSETKSAAPANQELPFHPLADVFPLMEGAEFDALVADIKANGLREPITLFEDKILDGRNRYRACLAAGVEPRCEERFEGNGYPSVCLGDPAAYVISKNIRRRHLTAEQKRELIAKVLKGAPEKSDRAIGRMIKADKNTVAAVRAKEEARGEIHHVETRTDTKGRKQPSRKPTKIRQPDNIAAIREKERHRQKEAPKVGRRTKLDRELDAGALSQLRVERARGDALTERVRQLEIENVGLKSEIEELKAERDRLCERVAELEEVIASVEKIDQAIDAKKPKRPRGRPKGSKNKPKAEPATATELPVDDGLDIPDCLRREPKAVSS